MGAQLTYLRAPVTSKETEDGAIEGSARYGACRMQGWRREMEDSHMAVPDVDGTGRVSVFGVFDGHGGRGVALYAAKHLPRFIAESKGFSEQKYADALRQAFFAIDDAMREQEGRDEVRDLDAPDPNAHVETIQMAVTAKDATPGASKKKKPAPKTNLAALLGSDSEENEDEEDEEEEEEDSETEVLEISSDNVKRNSSPEEQGCTAVVALISWGESGQGQRPRVYVANVGDCRGFLCRVDSSVGIQALALSEDHKPELPAECARVKAAGGRVQMLPKGARVQGELNISRALGDLRHKRRKDLPPEQQIITADPEIHEHDLESGDLLLVLVCDGIAEKQGNQELAETLHERLQKSPEGDANQLLSCLGTEVCDACLCSQMCVAGSTGRGKARCDGSGVEKFDGKGCDNMTIVLVEFFSDCWTRPLMPPKQEATQPQSSEDDAEKPPIS